MAELAYAGDLRSPASNGLWVRVPPRVLKICFASRNKLNVHKKDFTVHEVFFAQESKNPVRDLRNSECSSHGLLLESQKTAGLACETRGTVVCHTLNEVERSHLLNVTKVHLVYS